MVPSAPPPRSAPPLPPSHHVAAVAFMLDPTASFTANLRRLLELKLRRPLSDDLSEWRVVAEAASEALNLLQSPRDSAATRRLLDEQPMQRALSSAGITQLWASSLELADADELAQLMPVAFAKRLVRVVGDVAAAVFASAFEG